MNKLKSLFKKDKDGESESTSQSGSYGSSQQATGGNTTNYAQGGAAAAAGTGAGGYQQQQQQQSTPQMQQTQGSSAVGQNQKPTATSFPPNDAPSTGVENADNAEGVVLHTTLGDITIALFSQQCPRVRIPSRSHPRPPKTNKSPPRPAKTSQP